MSNTPWTDLAEASEIFVLKVARWNEILTRIRDHNITSSETLHFTYEEKLYFFEKNLMNMVQAGQAHSPEFRQLVIDTLEKYIPIYKQLIDEINEHDQGNK